MNNISIYGAGHLTKSLLTGLESVSDATISIFNRTDSKIDALKSIYRNLEKKNSLDELIEERTLLFCIIPGSVLMNLDITFIEHLKQTRSILISCVNGLPLETLSEKYKDLKIIKLLPNINWQICEGVSLFDYNDKVTGEEINTFYELLNPVTKLYRVHNDIDFENVGTLSTCSPGLFSSIIDYFIQYFKLESLTEKEIFYESIKGTMDYIIRSKKDPKTISSEVANKGGLTEVGINALQEQFPFCVEVVRTNMKNKIEDRTQKFKALL